MGSLLLDSMSIAYCCDACRTAYFATYEEACCHEEACDGTRSSVNSGRLIDSKRSAEDIVDGNLFTSPEQKRPRLDSAGSGTSRIVSSTTASGAAVISSVWADCNLMAKIASFIDINSGESPMSLLITLGARSSKQVRHGYLVGNDGYLLRALRVLARKVRWAQIKGKRDPTVKAIGSRLIIHLRPDIVKCRDDVREWLKVNTEWRSRCTDANLELCKNLPLADGEIVPLSKFEVTMIFNNPALAIELGLTEVFRHQVEVMQISGPGSQWSGFAGAKSFVQLALVQNDTDLLNFLLSTETFSTSKEMNVRGCLGDIFYIDTIGIQCLKAFISSPKVDLHAPVPRSPLTMATRSLRALRLMSKRCSVDERVITLRKEKIFALLELGADPGDYYGNDLTNLDFTDGELCKELMPEGNESWKAVWQDVLDKMRSSLK